MSGWNRFWFEPTSTAPVVVFRALMAVLVLANAGLLAPELLRWYGPDAAVSAEAARLALEGPGLDLLRWVQPLPLFAVHVLAALGLLLAWRPRLCAALAYLTLTSFHHANPLIWNAGDTLMRVGCFLLVFMPVGRAPAAPWAQRLMQLQLSAMYLVAVASKLHGRTWRDGTAVYYALRTQEYQHLPVPWLADNLGAIQVATYGTLGIELAMATLVWWQPARRWVLLAGVGLHLALGWALALQLFQPIVLACYVLFLDPRRLEEALYYRHDDRTDAGPERGVGAGLQAPPAA